MSGTRRALGHTVRGVAQLRSFGRSESALADLEPRASAPLNGSHLGAHTRPMGPCNTAIFTEAIGSLVHSLRRHLLIHQPQIRTEVIDDEDEFNLTRWEVPLKGLGLHRRKETVKINALGRIGCFLGNSREHPSIEFLRSLQMAHLDAVKHRLADKYGDRVWRIWL